LIPRSRAVRTARMPCFSSMAPCVPPSGAAPNPTTETFQPVFPRIRYCMSEFRRQRPDLDIAKRDLAVIALQRDVTGVGLREEWHLVEFALGHARLELLAAQHVLEILNAIDVVLALLGSHDEAHLVPFAGGFRGIERPAGGGVVRRLVKGIEAAATNRVLGRLVVFELGIRARPPPRAPPIGAVKHDPPVAASPGVVLRFEGDSRGL